MIVRVLGDAQYEVADDLHSRLNEIDAQATAAVESGDEAELHARLEELTQVVTDAGTRLDDDRIAISDLIIPPGDLTLDEARQLFSGDGLIPDIPVQSS